MHVMILGNSGSGKTTLARQLAARDARLHVDLDAFAWERPGVRLPTPQAVARIRDHIQARPAVIEGCYGALVEALLTPSDRLIWLDLPVAQCEAHCRARPHEPHKWDSASAQDAFLPNLLAFVRTYPERDDDLGAAAHGRVFDAHSGPKERRVDRISAP